MVLVSRNFAIQPSDKARQTLLNDIEAAKQEAIQAAKRKAEDAERESRKAKIDAAANLAVTRQTYHKFEGDTRLYSTGWVEWADRRTPDEKVEIELRRHDRVTRRILGIPCRTELDEVQIHMRLASTTREAYGEPDFIVRFEPDTPYGPLVSVGDPNRVGQDDYWRAVETDSDEWREIGSILAIFHNTRPTTSPNRV